MQPDAAPKESLPWAGAVLASTNVKEHWYAVSTSLELTADRPHPVRVLGEPMVLFRDAKKVARAWQDRCPHKNVKLSDGKMDKGTLECFYHGWQFDSDTGAITKVPALPGDCPLPKQRVKTFPCAEVDELIWVYTGNPAEADPEKIPTKPIKQDYKKRGYWRMETMIDLPCDHSYFVENLMDIAHTPWAHDGTFNKRNDAVPLKPTFCMTPTGMHGFADKVHTGGQENSLAYEWTAPCTNEVNLHKVGGSWHIHLFFHSTPTAPGQMRHINVTYRNGEHFLRLIPRSLRPVSDLMVIHGDTIAMMSQARNMKEGCPHITVATPSDEMAIKYRKWYSKAFGGGNEGPWWKGWDGKLDIEDLATSAMETCLPQFSQGVYERAAASTNSSTNCEYIVDMWKVQRRARKPLGFEKASSWFSPIPLLIGLTAGFAAAMLALQHRR